MKSISIRELHMHTGKWVRAAGVSREPVIVMDRGRPAARLVPLENAAETSFSARRAVPGFDELPALDADSGAILEDDRR
ncbi:MAG: type II toxin-antitoxin system Phd/YefM family antitoxin [Opitutales bacterium]|nr:type II toxin-antitoxin system Phd/YefM family antitoxin [Opitutales bacterium]